MKTKKLCIIQVVVETKIIILCVIFRRSSIAQWPRRSRQAKIIYHDLSRLDGAHIYTFLRAQINWLFISDIAGELSTQATEYFLVKVKNLRQPKMQGKNEPWKKTANRFKSAFLVLCCSNIYQMSTKIFGLFFYEVKSIISEKGVVAIRPTAILILPLAMKRRQSIATFQLRQYWQENMTF